MAKVFPPRHPSYTHLIPSPPGVPRIVPTIPFANYAAMRIIEKVKHDKATKGSGPPQAMPADTRVPPRERAERIFSSNMLASNINDIVIYDFDWEREAPDSGIATNIIRSLVLPTIPRTLELDGTPNWAVIPSIGRNTPFFHYSGSEDTLSFTIDWYAREESRKDVIFACRWLESKSKADGYNSDPHRIQVIWGKENLLFGDSLWIVFKAPYKLSEFHKNHSMLPNQAFQEVVLKRVCDFNLSTFKLLWMPREGYPTPPDIT